jgi:hypothetical protein
MRQFKITTANVTPADNDDCVLDSNDPIHDLMKVSAMGGLGTDQALASYRSLNTPKIEGSDKGRIAREQNIKPGTEEWFKHWFGNKK